MTHSITSIMAQMAADGQLPLPFEVPQTVCRSCTRQSERGGGTGAPCTMPGGGLCEDCRAVGAEKCTGCGAFHRFTKYVSNGEYFCRACYNGAYRDYNGDSDHPYAPCETPLDVNLVLPNGIRLMSQHAHPLLRSSHVEIPSGINPGAAKAAMGGISWVFSLYGDRGEEMALKAIREGFKTGKRPGDIYDEFYKPLRLADWEGLILRDEPLSSGITYGDVPKWLITFPYRTESPDRETIESFRDSVKAKIREIRDSCVVEIEKIKRQQAAPLRGYFTRDMTDFQERYANGDSCWFYYDSKYGKSRCNFRHSGGLVFVTDDCSARFLLIPLTKDSSKNRYKYAYSWRKKDYESIDGWMIFNYYKKNRFGSPENTDTAPLARWLAGTGESGWYVGKPEIIDENYMYVNDMATVITKDDNPSNPDIRNNDWESNTPCKHNNRHCWHTRHWVDEDEPDYDDEDYDDED